MSTGSPCYGFHALPAFFGFALAAGAFVFGGAFMFVGGGGGTNIFGGGGIFDLSIVGGAGILAFDYGGGAFGGQAR